MPRSLKKETLPSPQVRCPCPAHLCCCKLNSGVSWLPEPGRAGQNLSTALEPSTGSCKEQLSKHNTSTKASLNTPNLANCSAVPAAEPVQSTMCQKALC